MLIETLGCENNDIQRNSIDNEVNSMAKNEDEANLSIKSRKKRAKKSLSEEFIHDHIKRKKTSL